MTPTGDPFGIGQPAISVSTSAMRDTMVTEVSHRNVSSMTSGISDRSARTRRLRMAIVGVTVVGLACLALSMTTGSSENQRSEPVPFHLDN